MKRYLKAVYDGAAKLYYAAIYAVLKWAMVRLYQPVYGKKDNAATAVTRECEDRWNVIRPALGAGSGAVLDIGCNVGFFSFKAAETGRMAVGIDHDSFNVLFCNAIRSATRSEYTLFANRNLDLAALKKLPQFETIFNFSVFHHWVKAYGADEAKEMMRVIAQKCDCLFFETGQSNETGTKWAGKLAFMGDNPKDWIQSFLQEIGFSDVRVIGTFATGLTNVDRYMFVARKS